MQKYDIAIIGAGASGLTAARVAALRGRRVVVMDMGAAPARKVAVSGGGRCNFTNTAASRDRYFGENPDFVRGALARFSPADMIGWMQEQNLNIIQKAPGQYFCASGAGDVVRALVDSARGATIMTNTRVIDAQKTDGGFVINTTRGRVAARAAIIATGGTSFEALDVSAVGFEIAKNFGHKIVPVRPALCAIATDAFPSDFAGVSLDAEIRIGRNKITDALLFTHFGIGGPAVYRATVRDQDADWCVNLLPGVDAAEFLRTMRQTNGRRRVGALLSQKLPARIAKWAAGAAADKNIADIGNAEISHIAARIAHTVIPAARIKYHGMRSAEVVRGGVSTQEVSSKTMESKLCPGLFFAGEVLDIAGDLGGFNLHWAWASGFVAGTNA